MKGSLPTPPAPSRLWYFPRSPKSPLIRPALSCQPERCRRLHFDSCSWKIQLPPSSSSPFCPPPTCLEKKRMRERKGPAIPPRRGLPRGGSGAAPGKGHGPFLPPQAPRAAGDAQPEAGTVSPGRDGGASEEEERAEGSGLARKRRFGSRPGLLYPAGNMEKAKGFPGLRDTRCPVISSP